MVPACSSWRLLVLIWYDNSWCYLLLPEKFNLKMLNELAPVLDYNKLFSPIMPFLLGPFKMKSLQLCFSWAVERPHRIQILVWFWSTKACKFCWINPVSEHLVWRCLFYLDILEVPDESRWKRLEKSEISINIIWIFDELQLLLHVPIARTFPSSDSSGTGFPEASINLHRPVTPIVHALFLFSPCIKLYKLLFILYLVVVNYRHVLLQLIVISCNYPTVVMLLPHII